MPAAPASPVPASLFPPDATPAASGAKVWKVSELNRSIKRQLEGAYGMVWIEGEVSNWRRPGPSGHAYFSLKDASAQIKAVMFAGDFRRVRFPLDNGVLVRGYGAVTVYEAGGVYQIRLLKLEPMGVGALMLQFEALKRKLAAEGLFDPARKRPLPVLPQHIGVVTSPTGAAFKDILKVLHQRFANLHILLAPARVQGAGAAEDVAAGIRALNDWSRSHEKLDVLIVGRGGGSLEDLWCFNEEPVVRAIAASEIPVISAVGHQIDTTLSDYAADLRAATPSDAAELVIKSKTELLARIDAARKRLALAPSARIQAWRRRLDAAGRTVRTEPARRLRDLQQRADMAALRLQRALAGLPDRVRRRADAALRRARAALDARAAAAARRLAVLPDRLRQPLALGLQRRRDALRRLAAQLRLLDPRAVLRRGYSLTRLPGGALLRRPGDAPPGTLLTTELAEGTVQSVVPPAQGDEHGTATTATPAAAPRIRGLAGTPGDHRQPDGKRPARPGRHGQSLRGGPETGQGLLF